LDTSALAKHYHLEQGSAEVNQPWSDPARGLYVSRLSAVELISVFAGKLRGGAIAIADFEALRRRFAADLTKTRRLVGTRLLVAHYQEAEQLLRKHGPVRRLRTLDALQLAVAVDLHRQVLIERIVSSDKDLLAAAAAEGLGVFDPKNP
jgi:predicted nucleic acid-binding protein